MKHSQKKRFKNKVLEKMVKFVGYSKHDDIIKDDDIRMKSKLVKCYSKL